MKKLLIILCLSIFSLSFYANSKVTKKEFSYNDSEEYNPLGDEDLKKLYMSASLINQLYLVRLLLKNPENCEEAFDRVGMILRKRGLPKAAIYDLEVVQNSLHKCMKTSPVQLASFFTNRSYSDRPFPQARLVLNQAIMNSRIKLNLSFRSEKILIKKLLDSYFFPGAEDKGKIIFPASDSYKFEKYMLSETVLIEKYKLYASDAKKVILITEDKMLRAFMEKARDFLVEILEKVEFKDEKLSDGDKSIVNSLTGGLFDQLSAEDKTIALKALTEAIKNYNFGDIVTRQDHDTLNHAMLLQIIAEPGSLGLDPQLRDFAKGIRLEIKIDDVGEREFNSLKELYESNCKTISATNEITLDLNCMKERVASDSFYKSVQLLKVRAKRKRNTLDAFSTHTVSLVTGILGEDVEYSRGVLSFLKAYRLSEELRLASRNIPGMIWGRIEGAASKEVAEIFGSGSNLNDKANRSIKKAKRFIPKVLVVLKKLSITSTGKLVDIVANGIKNNIHQKLDIRKLPGLGHRFVLSGNLFRTIIGVNVFSDFLSLQRDLRISKLKVEKINSSIKYIANSLSLLSYVLRTQVVKTVANSAELGAIIIGYDSTAMLLDNAGYNFLPTTSQIYSSIMKKGAALYYGKSNLSELVLDNLEEQFKLPLGNFDTHYSDAISLAEESGEELNSSQKRAIAIFLASNASERLIKTIYFGHRMTNDEVGDIYLGKRMNDYKLQYASYRRRYQKVLSILREEK